MANLKRYTYEEVYNLVSSIGHTLLDKEYKNAITKMNIKCSCGEDYQMTRMQISQGYHHCDGRIRHLITKKVKRVLPRLCKTCKIEFTPKTSSRIFCSRDCYKKREQEKREKKTSIPQKECLYCKQIYQPVQNSSILCSLKCSQLYHKTEEYKEKARKWGVKAGMASVRSQQRRGKNEIYFAQLCEQYFGKENIKTNEPMFDGWDADVIIPGIKIAIGWNGIHHFFQIGKTQSLKQVQSRDLIKQKVIEKYGYTYYTIADLGKYNPRFVQQEFELFLFMKINY